MAKQSGCDGSFSIESKAVGYIDSFNLTIDHDSAEITPLGVNWKEYMSTIKGWSGSANAVVIDSSEHKALIDDLITGTDTELECTFKIGKEVSFVGKIKVTSAGINATKGEKTSLSINFQGTGALTVTGMTASA